MNHDKLYVQIYEDNIKSVYRYAVSKTLKKELAEDLTSKVFTIAYEKIRKGEYKHERKDFTWLISILRNLIGDEIRRKKDLNLNESDYEIPDFQESIKDVVLTNELKEMAKRYFLELDLAEREVLDLKIWQELKFREIAETLKITESLAKKLYYKGLKEIKMKISQEEKEEKRRFALAFVGLQGLAKDNLFIPSQEFINTTIAGTSSNLSKLFLQASGKKMITLFGKAIAVKTLVIGATVSIATVGAIGGTYYAVNHVNRYGLDQDVKVKDCISETKGFKVKIPMSWSCAEGLAGTSDEHNYVIKSDFVEIRVGPETTGGGLCDPDVIENHDISSCRTQTYFKNEGVQIDYIKGGIQGQGSMKCNLTLNECNQNHGKWQINLYNSLGRQLDTNQSRTLKAVLGSLEVIKAKSITNISQPAEVKPQNQEITTQNTVVTEPVAVQIKVCQSSSLGLKMQIPENWTCQEKDIQASDVRKGYKDGSLIAKSDFFNIEMVVNQGDLGIASPDNANIEKVIYSRDLFGLTSYYYTDTKEKYIEGGSARKDPELYVTVSYTDMKNKDLTATQMAELKTVLDSIELKK
jgi:RNA polymerase sigma-70 factor, ECF subfamily